MIQESEEMFIQKRHFLVDREIFGSAKLMLKKLSGY